MKKPYNIIFILILITDVVIGIVLFQQNSLLTKYEHKITSLEVKMEDLDDVIEGDVVPRLQEILAKTNNDTETDEVVANWKVREAYMNDGKVLLEVFPELNIVAGKSCGYLFHFTEPFDRYKGKELAIYAYHKETGEKITAVPPKIITKPSPGYSSLERFTANFVIPKSGLWRYEVVLNGEFYADVVLSVSK